MSNSAEVAKRIQTSLYSGFLDLSRLELTELPEIPPTTRDLNISFNRLRELRGLPAGLTGLNARNNMLEHITAFPVGLDDISLSENNLNGLPELPPRLKFLYLNGNRFSRLPAIPEGAYQVHANNNQLTEITNIPNSLFVLDLSGNRLDSLPASIYGSRIETLDVTNNQLTRFHLPHGLNTLRCNGNQLTELPALPARIQTLLCAHNRLTRVPDLNKHIHLNAVDFADNQLRTLPLLPNVSLVFRGVNFDRNPLNEFNQRIYETYSTAMAAAAAGNYTAKASIQSEYNRDIRHYRATIGNARNRWRGVSAVAELGRSRGMNEDTESVIASMLSGTNGTLRSQKAAIKRMPLRRGGRKTRRLRR